MTVLFLLGVLAGVVVVWRTFKFTPMNDTERSIGQAIPPSGRPSTMGGGVSYTVPGLSEHAERDAGRTKKRRRSRWER